MEDRGSFYILDELAFFRQWPAILTEHRGEHLGLVVRLNARRVYSQEDFIKIYGEFSRKLFAQSELPDAIMCANDRAACSVFDAAYESDIRIPRDVAVVGADDDSIGRLSMFRLTTVRMDIARSSKATVEMLMECLKNGKAENREVFFPSKLVLRQSCGRQIAPDGEKELVVRTQDLPEQEPVEGATRPKKTGR
jgi:hypothetical protein